MKKHIFSSILLVFFVQLGLYAADPILPSIKQVTVFRSGSQIVRTTQVPLSTGVQELVFSGFGAGFSLESVQIKPSTSVRIVSISFESNFLNPLEKKPEYKALINDQKAILSKFYQEQIIRESLQSELDLLLANKQVGGTESGLNPESLTRVAEIYRMRLPEIRNKILQSDVLLGQINEQQEKINQQLEDMQGKHPQQQNLEIHVTVEANASGTQPFEISYFHPSAGWATAYDLRVKSLTNPVELTNRAQVWQSTGEDWKQIELTVSTGSPSRQMKPSVLAPYQIDFVDPMLAETYGSRNSEKMFKESSINSRPSASTTKDDFNLNQVGVRENLTFLEYQLPGRANLNSTQKPSTFELENHKIPAEFKYHVVPKRDQYAFLQAYISNWQDYNLSEGEMSIFFEGTFVGKNYFNPRQVLDTLALSLGPDIAVQVKRERIAEKCKTATLFGKSSKDVAFRIKIRNNKPNPINLTIQDQIPVSVQNTLEVEVDQLSGGDLNNESGIVTWNVDLPSAQSVTKEVSYTVKYPKGKRISATD
jgi:uncharacterized protein (TIGR02231 family)